MKTLSRKSIDLAVGIFLVIALVCTTFIALRAANITDITDRGGYTLIINFENIGSLAKRAPVKSSGVRIGQVKEIAYDNENYAASVAVVIEDRYQFPADSIFSIVSGNLLGGQYIAIEVGGDDAVLKHNDEIEGNSAIILEDLISRFLFDNAGKEE